MLRWTVSCILPLLAALGGCGSRPSPTIVVPAPDAATLTCAADFPAAAGILPGFELADGPVQWRIGDRVLLGIRFTRRDRCTHRLLLVELSGEQSEGGGIEFKASSRNRPYTLRSDVVRTRMTLYDETGTVIEEAAGRFPVKLLGFGLYDGARWSIGASDPDAMAAVASSLDDAEFDRMMRGWLTLFSFSGSLNRRGIFQEMMESVVARPSLLAMLLNPSVAMTSQPPGPSTGVPWSPASTDHAAIETIEVPLTLSIAGKTALTGSVTAARPVAPLSLCGGVLRARAENPDDPGTSIEIRLLGASRGEGGQDIRPQR